MTKKNKLVPKSVQQVSGATIDRFIQDFQKNSVNTTPNLNAKIKRTYLNPKLGE